MFIISQDCSFTKRNKHVSFCYPDVSRGLCRGYSCWVQGKWCRELMGSRTEKCCGACRGGWWPRTNLCSAPNAACASPCWLLKRTANYYLLRSVYIIATLSERNLIMNLEPKLEFPVSLCLSLLWERFRPVWGAGDQNCFVFWLLLQ